MGWSHKEAKTSRHKQSVVKLLITVFKYADAVSRTHYFGNEKYLSTQKDTKKGKEWDIEFQEKKKNWEKKIKSKINKSGNQF